MIGEWVQPQTGENSHLSFLHPRCMLWQSNHSEEVVHV